MQTRPTRRWAATAVVILLLANTVWAGALEFRRALTEAAALEASGKVEAAIAIYRSLHSEHPRRKDILYRLAGALSTGGRFEEVVDLLKARTEKAPNDVTALSRLGDALYALGHKEEAARRWEGMLLGRKRPGAYALVAERFRKHNLFAEADRIYRTGRSKFGRPALFARELAELAERQARFPQAVAEYLRLLAESPSHFRFVDSRLKKFAKEADVQEEISLLLREEVLAHPDDDLRLRLLVDYELQSGHTSRALEVLMPYLRETPRHRSLVTRIAALSLEREAYETASTAYQTLLDRFGDPIVMSRILLGLARAQAGRGLTDEARQLYARVMENYAGHSEADEASYRLGDLMLQSYGDSAAATELFQSLADSGGRHPWRFKALFKVAEKKTSLGQFRKAEKAYSVIAEEGNPEDRDEARFRIADVRFLMGDFEDALDALKHLLSGRAMNYALNDALELAALIESGRGDSVALKAYAVAVGLDRMGQRVHAVEALEGLLARTPPWELRDRVMATMAGVLEASGRYTEVLQTWRRLIRETPRSPLCPLALIAQARVYENRLGQFHEAFRVYDALMSEYPLSLEVDEARVRLRTLKKRLREVESHSREAG